MTRRALFPTADDAQAVAARLRTDGFEAQVAKEPFAGEDDDEDHAWTVQTDAPAFLVDLLVEEHEGWLLDEDPAAPPAAAHPPLDLPDGPRRVKGHWPS